MLEKYTTTKPDKKNGISKIPTGEAVQMNDALFAVHILYNINSNRN